MTSEIRTNRLTSRAGLSTVTLSDTGPVVTGIATFGTSINIGVTTIHSNLSELHHVVSTGVITATKFVGDISDATGAAAGLGTALSQDQSNPLNKLFYTDRVLSIGSTITVDHPASATGAYTQYADIQVEDNADLIVADGDDLIPDILGLGGNGTTGAGGAGRLLVDNIVNRSATGAPTFPNGAVVTGVVTATSFVGNGAGLTNVSAGKILQYKYLGNNSSTTHNTQSWSDSGFGSVTITPTNATTINIISFTTKANVGSGGQTYYSIYFSTNSGGSYAQVPGLDSNNGMFRKANNNTDYTVSFRYAHDHNTTSTIIYKIYMNSQASTQINWDSGYGLLTVEEIPS